MQRQLDEFSCDKCGVKESVEQADSHRKVLSVQVCAGYEDLRSGHVCIECAVKMTVAEAREILTHRKPV